MTGTQWGCIVAAVLAFGLASWLWGRWHPAPAAVEAAYGERLDETYAEGVEEGWKAATAQDVTEIARVRYAEDNGYGPGWGDDTEFIPHGRALPAIEPGPAEATVITDAQDGAGAWLGQYAELAPAEEDERPASHTDQFHAVWDNMSRGEREELLQWDWKIKSKAALKDFDQWGRDFLADWRAELADRGAA